MKRAGSYNLNIRIEISRATMEQTGKALGMILRRHVTPRLAGCRIERGNGSETSRRAEAVLGHLLGRPAPWGSGEEGAPTATRSITLDDAGVRRLAKRWDSGGIADHTIVMPHIFYLTLLECALENLQQRAAKTLDNLCIIFDYAVLDHLPGIVRQSFFGERRAVLAQLRNRGLSFIDPGRQLYLENLISLACYTLPARRLVFMDDDFFISGEASIEALLAPLDRGHLMSGRYARGADRIHTSLFAMRPEALRDELLLFDDGKNLYSDKEMSTGTITYRRLSGRGMGVCSIGDYRDRDLSLGRHLCHCTGELWNDLPHILRKLFRPDVLTAVETGTRVDASLLLEALASLFGVSPSSTCDSYLHIDNGMRSSAVNDFAAYLSKIYNNHLWLGQHACSLAKEDPGCIAAAGQ